MRSPARLSGSSELSGLLLVALCGVIWGTIPLLLRAADGASVAKVFFRVAFGGGAIWLWLLVTGRTGPIEAPEPEAALTLASAREQDDAVSTDGSG